jgi:hypothetical protein
MQRRWHILLNLLEDHLTNLLDLHTDGPFIDTEFSGKGTAETALRFSSSALRRAGHLPLHAPGAHALTACDMDRSCGKVLTCMRDGPDCVFERIESKLTDTAIRKMD